MSLLDEIELAQRDAGEAAVMRSLERQGFGLKAQEPTLSVQGTKKQDGSFSLTVQFDGLKDEAQLTVARDLIVSVFCDKEIKVN